MVSKNSGPGTAHYSARSMSFHRANATGPGLEQFNYQDGCRGHLWRAAFQRNPYIQALALYVLRLRQVPRLSYGLEGSSVTGHGYG
jgi:hypothetical protein